MSFSFNDFYIPLNSGRAVGRGWLTPIDRRPRGVTWHWTAMSSHVDARGVLGGVPGGASRVSSHYLVGRRFSEGIDRYVSLENRSFHAGVEQKLRWDGKASTNDTKGARACIGIETTHIGYARQGFPAANDWTEAVDTDCKWVMKIAPWPEEQIEMMIAVGREIQDRWPHLTWQDHHGHHDICPGYKQDVAAFPFARILRAIYDTASIPDIWTSLLMPKQRQRVLIALGYDLGHWMDDGDWGYRSTEALSRFQADSGERVIPYWTRFTSLSAHRALERLGKDLDEVANTPLS